MITAKVSIYDDNQLKGTYVIHPKWERKRNLTKVYYFDFEYCRIDEHSYLEYTDTDSVKENADND